MDPTEEEEEGVALEVEVVELGARGVGGFRSGRKRTREMGGREEREESSILGRRSVTRLRLRIWITEREEEGVGGRGFGGS